VSTSGGSDVDMQDAIVSPDNQQNSASAAKQDTGASPANQTAVKSYTVDVHVDMPLEESEIKKVYPFVYQLVHAKVDTFFCMECKEEHYWQTWHNDASGNFDVHHNKYHKEKFQSPEVKASLDQYKRGSRKSGWAPRNNEEPMTPEEQQEIDQALCDWIVRHAHPFSVVAQKGFKKMCRLLNSRYKVPHRHKVQKLILISHKDDKMVVQTKVAADLKGRRVSITTDMWTSTATKGYMAVTGHYLDKNWQPRSFLIALIRVFTRHTSEELAKHLLHAIQEFSPELMENLWVVTADNASVNGKMIKLLNEGMLQEAINKVKGIPDSASKLPMSSTPKPTTTAPSANHQTRKSSQQSRKSTKKPRLTARADTSGSSDERAANAFEHNSDMYSDSSSDDSSAAKLSRQRRRVRKAGPYTSERVIFMRCLAHILQLAINHGIKKTLAMAEIIKIVREIVKKLHDSPNLLQRFKACCTELNIKYVLPPLDCKTRWNSMYDMLHSVLSVSTAIDKLLHGIRMKYPAYVGLVIGNDKQLTRDLTREDWIELERFRDLLEPFYDATVHLSASRYPTSSLVVPTYYYLMDILDRSIDCETSNNKKASDMEASGADASGKKASGKKASSKKASSREASGTEASSEEASGAGARDKETSGKKASSKEASSKVAGVAESDYLEFASAVRKKLRRFKNHITKPENLVEMALDPRTKNVITDLNYNHRQFTQDKLVKCLVRDWDEHYKADYEASKAAETPRLTGRKASHSAFFRTQYSNARKGETIETELSCWFLLHGLDLDSNSDTVMKWLQSNMDAFPRLRLMALDYLSVCATSVDSERAFSRAGIIVSDLRTRLEDDTIQAVCELQSYLVFLDNVKGDDDDVEMEQMIT
jgi:hAT family C-terminal dimerisation region